MQLFKSSSDGDCTKLVTVAITKQNQSLQFPANYPPQNVLSSAVVFMQFPAVSTYDKREDQKKSAKIKSILRSSGSNHTKEWSVVVGRSVCQQCLFEWPRGVQWMCVRETKEHR